MIVCRKHGHTGKTGFFVAEILASVAVDLKLILLSITQKYCRFGLKVDQRLT